MAFIGTLIVPFVQLIFPVVFYIMVTTGKRSIVQTIILSSALVIGVTAFGLGIYGLVDGLYQ